MNPYEAARFMLQRGASPELIEAYLRLEIARSKSTNWMVISPMLRLTLTAQKLREALERVHHKWTYTPAGQPLSVRLPLPQRDLRSPL